MGDACSRRLPRNIHQLGALRVGDVLQRMRQALRSSAVEHQRILAHVEQNSIQLEPLAAPIIGDIAAPRRVLSSWQNCTNFDGQPNGS